MTKKTYMINHIPIKQVWLEKKYYIDKRCKKMGGWKIVKETNEKKRFSITYHKTKVQKLGSPKNKRAKKPS
jgi:hypothetical protein